MYKSILKACLENNDAEKCYAKVVKGYTPWQLMKTESKCQHWHDKCSMAIAWDEETREVVDFEKYKEKVEQWRSKLR